MDQRNGGGYQSGGGNRQGGGHQGGGHQQHFNPNNSQQGGFNHNSNQPQGGFYPPREGGNFSNRFDRGGFGGGYGNNPNGGGFSNDGHRNQPQNNRYQNNFNVMAEPEKIVGEKPCRVMVREVWLGGIPEMCDKNYMHQLMSEFGMIENLEIFPKFAFIKFRVAEHASIAFERAQRISMMFNNPPGFRILFSDPSRRANVVSNHYEYDRQSPFLPILFLGFPPVTSANVDMDNIRGICEKYGEILNSYMRKNSNNQTRSYFLFSFADIKNALRAKIELNKRRDLLGDKRVEVTLLLDEEVILRGKDLSYTEKMFQGNQGQNNSQKPPGGQNYNNSQGVDKSRSSSERRSSQRQPPIHPQYGGGYPSHIPPPYGMGYPQHPQHLPPQSSQYLEYGVPTPGHNPSNTGYQPPGYYHPQQGGHFPSDSKMSPGKDSSSVHDILQSVLSNPSNGSTSDSKEIGRDSTVSYEKMPVRSPKQSDENVTDIVGKLLGEDNHGSQSSSHQQLPSSEHADFNREPSWSGFLTWKGLRRVGVDGHTDFKELQDYVINIMNVIEPKDLVTKENAYMILEPTNSISESTFREYIKALRNKIAVSFTSHSLIYVMAKCEQSDRIQKISENELLVVMQKPSLSSLIKEKLQKIEELKS